MCHFNVEVDLIREAQQASVYIHEKCEVDVEFTTVSEVC